VADVLKALQALRDLLEYNDAVYQTEYDGRMLTCCIGCDADLAVKGHENDCPVVRAQAALAAAVGVSGRDPQTIPPSTPDGADR
jgi:Mg-chelatase subunit ChlI